MGRHKLPREGREAVDRYNLFTRSRMERLDAYHQRRIVAASTAIPAFIEAVSKWVVSRWRVSLDSLRVLVSGRKEDLPKLESLVREGERRAVTRAKTALGNVNRIERGVALARVSSTVNAMTLQFMAAARLRVLADSPSEAVRPVRRVTQKVFACRRQLVKDYCRKHDLKIAEFARRVGISEDALRAIVREDLRRFSTTGVRGDLLQTLNLTVDEWYSE